MNNSPTVQSFLDKICLQRLTAPDFAQKQSLFDKLLHLIKGAAS
ncbi:hypothetical protein [Acinetobacter bereziniae]|nr:hypothetical protein [Acinetobacter bereziniae]